MESLRELAARYGGLAWRRRWWGILAAWIICLGGWSMIATLPNQYEADARVFIDADAMLTPLLKGIAVESSLQDELDLLSHMLLSRPNLERIIQKTDLNEQVVTATDTENMVQRLAGQIKVVAQSRTIFSINYRNTNRQLAADVVQAMLASFIENKAGSNRDDIDRATVFMDSQIAGYETQLRAAEARRADFRRKYIDLLPGDSGVNRLDTARETVKTLSGELLDMKAQRVLLANELKTTPESYAAAAAGLPNDPQTELRAAEARLRSLKQVYTAEYPEVVTQQHLVDELKKNPDSPAGLGAAGSTGRSVDNPAYSQLRMHLTETDAAIESLTRRITDATAERERLDTIAKGVPELEAQFVNMNRDYDILRKNYDELVARREGMRISDAADKKASNIKLVIIDPPTAPRVPVAPNRALLAIGVLVAGLGAGAAVVAAMLALDQSFHTIADLRALGMTVIGSVSLAVLPLTAGQRLRQISLFGTAFGLLFVALGGVLMHFSRAV